MKKKYVILAIVSLIVILIDQVTKMAIHSGYALHESHPIIDGFFNLTYVRNPGAAFGFLQGAPEIFRKIFFLSVTPVALLVIHYFLKTTKDHYLGQIVSLCLVFGGAIGNYIDRVRFGYVIDFLDFYLKGVHYPAFNVADSAIVVGIVFLLISTYRDEKA